MRIVWSSAAWSDLDRLHAFLAEHDLDIADMIFDKLANAPAGLLEFPRRGSRLIQFDSQEVREFRVGAYLLRYEVTVSEVFILRVFHARENRF